MEDKVVNILVSDTILEHFVEGIKQGLPEYQDRLTFVYSDGTEADLQNKILGKDIILGARNKLPGSVLEKADKAYFLQQVSAGFDNIDLDVAAQKGIKVANVGGSGVIAVAEHTIMLMMAIAKKLIIAHGKTIKGDWAFDELHLKVGELHEKTLGIIGMGRIAREVARLAHAFLMKVQYSDIAEVDTSEFADDVPFVSQEELLRTSDFISVHTNLTEETKNMMDANAFALMKPTAFLINTARGEVVDTEALYEALKEGKIAGAALDVLPTKGAEISKIDLADPLYEKLFKLNNVILTPHIAGATADNVRRTFEMACVNVIRVIQGQEPANVVN